MKINLLSNYTIVCEVGFYGWFWLVWKESLGILVVNYALGDQEW